MHCKGKSMLWRPLYRQVLPRSRARWHAERRGVGSSDLLWPCSVTRKRTLPKGTRIIVFDALTNCLGAKNDLPARSAIATVELSVPCGEGCPEFQLLATGFPRNRST